MSLGHANEHDVIIAGLGPTGLTLAHLLGMRGHRVLVLEREPRFYGNARAVYTDDECMRVFQAANVADDLAAKMLQEMPVQWVAPDGRPMGQYLPKARPFGWPVVNFFYQPYLETTLTERLAQYPNVEVRRGRELAGFDQDDGGVSVHHQATQTFRFTDDGDAKMTVEGALDPRTDRAHYLIAADGGRSVVRTLLGIEMTGKSFPEPWLVVDLKAKSRDGGGLRHQPYFSFYCDPECPAVSCPQPDGYHRFEFMLMPGDTKEHMEKPETVRRHLSKYVDPDDFEVKRRLVYTFNALIAKEWRRRRVLLAGDAAHMTPQFMGQGMSAGVRDAYNLAWKLDFVLRGMAGDALLDSYQRERHDHAKAMIDISVLMKSAVSASTPLRAAARDAFAALTRSFGPLHEFVREGKFKPSPAYSPGYFGVPRRRRSALEGRMVPQPPVRTLDGQRHLLDQLLGGGFALLGVGVDPRATLNKRARAYLDTLGTRYASVYGYGERPQGIGGIALRPPAGLIEVEDMSGELLTWVAKGKVGDDAVAVVRPDKFLFALTEAHELNAAVEALRAQLGAPASESRRAKERSAAQTSTGRSLHP